MALYPFNNVQVNCPFEKKKKAYLKKKNLNKTAVM
jgi:hypothetical protein